MKRIPALLRRAAALVLGLLLAAAVASPAQARHATVPQPFEVDNPGNNACTLFWAAGEAQWHPWHDGIDTPEVDVAGKAGIEQVGDICLDVELLPQHVEFTAYVGDAVVDRYDVPIEVGAEPFGFEFTLVSELGWSDGQGGFIPLEIERVTVRVCQTAIDHGEDPEPGPCGEEQILSKGR